MPDGFTIFTSSQLWSRKVDSSLLFSLSTHLPFFPLVAELPHWAPCIYRTSSHIVRHMQINPVTHENTLTHRGKSRHFSTPIQPTRIPHWAEVLCACKWWISKFLICVVFISFLLIKSYPQMSNHLWALNRRRQSCRGLIDLLYSDGSGKGRVSEWVRGWERRKMLRWSLADSCLQAAFYSLIDKSPFSILWGKQWSSFSHFFYAFYWSFATFAPNLCLLKCLLQSLYSSKNSLKCMIKYF